ncbi:hypothetical protein CCP3SC1AL1_1280001 [Gammaproteobacteria bacterium]
MKYKTIDEWQQYDWNPYEKNKYSGYES